MKKCLPVFFISVLSMGILGMGRLCADIVPGSLQLTFYPTGSSGSSGNWQPRVIIPSGDIFDGPLVPYNSTDPVSMEVIYSPGPYIETGSYAIEIKNQIENSVEESLVSSVLVHSTSQIAPMDDIVYRQMSTLSNGEASLLYYVVPQPPQS